MDREHARAVAAARFCWLGLAALAFDLANVTIKIPFLWRGVTVADAIEVVGVYVVLALYAWTARVVGEPDRARRGVLSAAAITYALGHGIHLAANSVHDMLQRTGTGDPWRLAILWDEYVGHYMVDAARIGFAVGLTWVERGATREACGEAPPFGGGATAFLPFARPALLYLGALAYGFIYFAAAVEGQTVPMALPFCAAYAAWSAGAALRDRRGGRLAGVSAPARAFFTAAAWISLLLFAVWGIWRQGFPEFTKTGILQGP